MYLELQLEIDLSIAKFPLNALRNKSTWSAEFLFEIWFREYSTRGIF